MFLSRLLLAYHLWDFYVTWAQRYQEHNTKSCECTDKVFEILVICNDSSDAIFQLFFTSLASIYRVHAIVIGHAQKMRPGGSVGYKQWAMPIHGLWVIGYGYDSCMFDVEQWFHEPIWMLLDNLWNRIFRYYFEATCVMRMHRTLCGSVRQFPSRDSNRSRSHVEGPYC